MTVTSRKSAVAAAAAAVATSCLLAACGGASGGGGGGGSSTGATADIPATAPDSLTIGITPAPDNLDPGGSGLAVDGWVSGNVNEPLLFDYRGKLYPGLVTRWKMSPDARTWTLTLRRGVTFQDGTPFNGAAVKATFDHVVDPATKSRAPLAMLGPYASTTVVDDATVRVNFRTPNAGFEYAMANIVGGVNSPTAMQKAGSAAAYGRRPVGAGPYAIDDFVFNQRITLSAFDRYDWAPSFMGASGAAPVRQLTLRILPDDKARANALKTGELDIAGAVDPQDAVSLTASGNFVETRVDSTGQPYGIPLNVDKFPTDDVNVRRAIILATDRRALISTLFDDEYEPATQLLTPTSEGYDPSLTSMYDTDVDRAGQILDADGWRMGSDGIREKDGRKLTLQMINIAGFGFDGISQLLQAQLKRVGMDVQITEQAFPTVAATMNQGKQNLADFFYYDLDSRDALYATLDSSQIRAGYNWAHYSNPTVDRLLQQANADPRRRPEVLRQVQRVAMDDAVFDPIYDLRQLWVSNARVGGVKFNLSGYPLFYTTK